MKPFPPFFYLICRNVPKRGDDMDDKKKEIKSMEILVKKAKRRDEKALVELLSMYQEYLYRIAYAYYKNEQQALDAVSECVMKIYIHIPQLKKTEYFKTWITRILINEVLRDISKQSNQTSLELLREQGIELQNSELVLNVSQEQKMDLYHALDLLPSEYRKVIILKYFQDMKSKEIAEIMEIPEGTVKTLLHRGKKRLRTIMVEEMGYEIS